MKLIKIILLFFIVNFVFAQTNLYPGEQLLEINHTQTLFKFIKGDKDKPLIIFVPGAAHLARIAYGFPGGREDDFLSYWLHADGYSFLGISYPTDNSVYTKIYPAFNIHDWGQQIARLAQMIIAQNHLSPHVVIVAWSMGGNVEEAATEALEKNNIQVDAFIGLSAVTPLSYLGQTIKGYKGNEMLSNKLLDARVFNPLFIKLIAEQGVYNGHEIIPEKIYTSEFLGNIPVAIEGQGYCFAQNKFVFDPQKILDESGVFRFAHTPWIGLINDDSASVPKITLIDISAWNYIRSEMLYAQYIVSKNLSDNSRTFSATKQLLNQIPQQLCETVHGTHFFFVGKKGAQETAQKIELILQRIDTDKRNIGQV